MSYRPKKFAIRKWLGSYQSHLIYLYGGRNLKVNSYGLEKFFGYFAPAKYLHEFSVTDVAEYINWRKSEGANPTTLAIEIRSVRRFYSWLIDHHNYPHANPALAFSPLPSGVEKKSLTLKDVRRILSACDNPLTRDFVLSLLTGTTRLNGMTWKWHAMKLKRAFELCGLKVMKLGHFREMISQGLWSDIMRLNEQKLRDAFISEAELNSYAFRDIQITTGDKRPPVRDSDLDFFVV